MQHCLTRLAQLKRPRIMMRAARIGAQDYRRNVHLPRILGPAQMPSHGDAITRLLELEDELNTRRTGDGVSYPMLRHLDVMIALVAEARLLRTSA